MLSRRSTVLAFGTKGESKFGTSYLPNREIIHFYQENVGYLIVQHLKIYNGPLYASNWLKHPNTTQYEDCLIESSIVLLHVMSINAL
jgi:hypothetical protein